MDHLGIEQFVLMGLSMGGYVAFAFLREFGGMVRGLILSDTRAEADSDEARARREQQAVEVLRDGTKPMADRLITGMLTARTREENPLLTGQVYEMMRSQKPVGMAGALRGMASRPDSTEILDSIRVPTLIMVGEEDTVTPVADSRRMADRIVGSELVVIPGSAHLTSLERPDAVNSAVRAFLERLSR
jgi:3-oxoadipate enol-lactonase